MALTTIPSELSSVSGISDSSSSTAITIDSSQNVTFSGNITTGSNTISGVLSSVTGSIGSAATATTQAASDNSTKLATTAYVTTALANLVDSAPGTLNTLNELAAALGDDANFSTTVTNSIATKAPLANPTFTGSFTSPGIDDNASSTAVTIDSNNRMAIGGTVVTDVNLLNIQGSGSSSNIGVVLNDTSTSKIYSIQNGGSALKFFDYSTSTEIMRLSGGKVTIGGSSTTRLFNLDGTADAYMSFNPSSHRKFTIGSDTNGFIIFDDTASQYRMTIDSSGDVQARRARSNTAGEVALSVQPSDSTIHYGFRIDSSTNSFNLDRVDSAGNLLTVSSAGNVGIGTDSPTFGSGSGLEVSRSGTATVRVERTGSTATSGEFFAGNGKVVLSSISNNSLEFRTNNTKAYEIGATNNHVFYQTNGSTVGMELSASGALAVAGNVTYSGDLVSSTSGTSNFRAGVNAGNSIISGGNYNVLVGDEAGTALTTGDENVAIGFNALATEDGHGKNVAIGKGALNVQNAGADAYNVAVGHSAGTSVTTGIQNTLIGGLAGDTINTGSHNVAVGHSALGALQSAEYNVAIGFQAADNLITGHTNVVIGKNAMYNSGTTLDYNVAIGGETLTETSTSSQTAVGFRALRLATSGEHNTAMGYECMEGVVTGDRNSCFGKYAGKEITSGESNTMVGYQAGRTVNGAAIRNVVIGDSAWYYGTNGDENVIIGTFAAGDNTGNHESLTGSVYIGQEAGHINVGSWTTAVGYQAGYKNYGGSSVFVGYRSGGYSNSGSSGDNNVAVGYQALYAVTTGSDNVVVGRDAGAAITTGYGNVFLGRDAGDSATSGYRNICIGQNANPSSASGEHQIILGHDISGPGDNHAMIGRGGQGYWKLSHTVNTGWVFVSDERIKKNIQNDTLGLEFINKIRPVTYNHKKNEEIDADFLDSTVNWKKGDADDTVLHRGLVAQEVKAAMQEVGNTDFDGWSQDADGMQGISKEAFITPLIKAVQELSAEVTALKAEVAALKGE